MKTSMFEKGIPMLSRVCALAVMILVPVGFFEACIGGLTDTNLSDGTRCNPYTSHNECKSGSVCAGYPPSTTIIAFCPENYCCAVDSNGNIVDTDPVCQPGCNGGAAAICAADKDPGACLFADAGPASLQAAEELDNAGAVVAPTPDASTDAAPLDAAPSTDATPLQDAAPSTDAAPLDAAPSTDAAPLEDAAPLDAAPSTDAAPLDAAPSTDGGAASDASDAGDATSD